MSASKIEEICKIGGKKNSSDRKYTKYLKDSLHRRERRKLKQDPEHNPEYRKFNGWEH